MDSAGSPLAGPFCGFDDAFSVGMVPGLPDGTNQADSEHYDYYYEQLLNTHNLGDLAAGGLFFTAPLVVGLKTDRTVHNYGFKLNYDLSGTIFPPRSIFLNFFRLSTRISNSG